ncbi:MAG TPA: glycosyltransferase family 2 protein [Solirubrobacteraceae bacterium]|nr:glycosyltransferase family 2 protein [Solirubrobacteraceae bacterium]
MNDADRPALSIGIVLYNSAGTLQECLRSVHAELESGFAELIAVNNASPDDSVAIVRAEVPAGRIVEMDANRGYAAGVNAAVARARGRYWLLLNPDVRAPVGGLRRLVAWMDAHPEVGIASPDLVDANGRWEEPGRALPSVGRTLLRLSRLHRLLPAGVRQRVFRAGYWTGGDQLDAGWVPGTAMIVRPAAVRAVGVLREELFMYGEDVEWCWRVRRAGWRIGVCSSITFVHDTSSSARASFSESALERRISEGLDGACRLMYGRRHARVLAALTALMFALDGWTPGKTRSQRDRARAAARVWRGLAARRDDAPSRA